MPLPLPNLDTRRWSDLVEEGQALIPVHAPAWTDHNTHDPGVTLMELLAWLVEQDIFRVNQIPRRHLRKFLALAGYLPEPARPARAALRFTLKTGESALKLPAGLALTGQNLLSNGPKVYFRAEHAANIIPNQISTVLVFDGNRWLDHTLAWQEGASYPAWGEDPIPHTDPEKQPALYLGFDSALPAGVTARLWLEFDGARATWEARQGILAEASLQAQTCTPIIPNWPCPGEISSGSDITPAVPLIPPHHSVRTTWEYYDGSQWQALDPASDQVADDTRSFSLSGSLQLSLPGAMAVNQPFSGAPAAFFLRCRMSRGRPDAAPRLLGLFLNAVEVRQCRPERHVFPILAGVTPAVGQEPLPGKSGPLQLTVDSDGRITSLAFGVAANGPETLVLEYLPATASQAGRLAVTLLDLGDASGYPLQHYPLADLPLEDGLIQFWSLEGGALKNWQCAPDLDPAGADDAVFSVDDEKNMLQFGDGLHGRVPPKEARLLAAYQTTIGTGGNLPGEVNWRLSEADDLLNAALTAGSLAAIAAKLDLISNPLPAHSGHNLESLEETAGRAVERLWAHERLVDLAQTRDVVSLDQVSAAERLARTAPLRANTLLDFERLALETPGVTLARARAFSGIDPAYPCLAAPGTVTVVVIPVLPAGSPQPTSELLAIVRAYLERRRVIGTHLLVVGPQYLTVTVQAQVQLWEGSDPTRVRQDILQRLNTFLDPLVGGPDGSGWPFGRDVYRSEILQVIDGTEGVDHVLSLELLPGKGEVQCANMCLGPFGLTRPGEHRIEISRKRS